MLTAYQFKKDKSFLTELTRAQMLTALHEKDSLLWVDLQDSTTLRMIAWLKYLIFTTSPLKTA